MGKSVLLNNTLKATKIQAKYHEDATKYSRKVKKYDQQNTSSISLVTPGPLTRHLQVPKSKKGDHFPIVIFVGGGAGIRENKLGLNYAQLIQLKLS